MENTASTYTIINRVNGHAIEVTANTSDLDLTAAQRARVEWLDANLADGVSSVYIYSGLAGKRGVANVTTGGHPEGRLCIEVNALGGMSAEASSADVLGDFINNAPAI